MPKTSIILLKKNYSVNKLSTAAFTAQKSHVHDDIMEFHTHETHLGCKIYSNCIHELGFKKLGMQKLW